MNAIEFYKMDVSPITGYKNEELSHGPSTLDTNPFLKNINISAFVGTSNFTKMFKDLR
jgi:hypothetical protein